MPTSEKLASKLFPMYCPHFNGAFCEACAPVEIEKFRRRVRSAAIKECIRRLEVLSYEARSMKYTSYDDAISLCYTVLSQMRRQRKRGRG